jgi:hypothetical protein
MQLARLQTTVFLEFLPFSILIEWFDFSGECMAFSRNVSWLHQIK